MKTLACHLFKAILICALSLLLAAPAHTIRAESANDQEATAQAPDGPRHGDQIDSAALPDDIRKAVLAHTAVFAPHEDFMRYEWRDPEIVKSAKIVLTERTRSLIRGLIPQQAEPKEVYCITLQADEVCTKTHSEFRPCEVAPVNGRKVPLGYHEEITAGKKGRFNFNWIVARAQGGKMYIVNFRAEPPKSSHVKDDKWAAVCPYEQIFTYDHWKKKEVEEEKCSKWLKANPNYLKTKMAQEDALAKMLSQPGKSFKSYNDVIEKLGKPKSMTTTKIDNRHDPSTKDIIKTLTYRGLVVAVYQVPKHRKEFITRLTLTKRPKQLKLPVTLGASRDFALSRLGEPSRQQGDTITYLGDSTELSIQFKDSKVSRIEWICFPN